MNNGDLIRQPSIDDDDYEALVKDLTEKINFYQSELINYYNSSQENLNEPDFLTSLSNKKVTNHIMISHSIESIASISKNILSQFSKFNEIQKELKQKLLEEKQTSINLTTQIQGIKEDLVLKDVIIHKFEEEIKSYQKENNEQLIIIQNLENEKSSEKQEFKSMTSTVTQQINDFSEEKQKFNQKINYLENNIEVLNSKIQALENENLNKKQEIIDINNINNDLLEEIRKLKENINEKNQSIELLKIEIKDLNESNYNLRENLQYYEENESNKNQDNQETETLNVLMEDDEQNEEEKIETEKRKVNKLNRLDTQNTIVSDISANSLFTKSKSIISNKSNGISKSHNSKFKSFKTEKINIDKSNNNAFLSMKTNETAFTLESIQKQKTIYNKQNSILDNSSSQIDLNKNHSVRFKETQIVTYNNESNFEYSNQINQNKLLKFNCLIKDYPFNFEIMTQQQKIIIPEFSYKNPTTHYNENELKLYFDMTLQALDKKRKLSEDEKEKIYTKLTAENVEYIEYGKIIKNYTNSNSESESESNYEILTIFECQRLF